MLGHLARALRWSKLLPQYSWSRSRNSKCCPGWDFCGEHPFAWKAARLRPRPRRPAGSIAVAGPDEE